MDTNRRNVLRTLGATVGATALAGCGSQGKTNTADKSKKKGTGTGAKNTDGSSSSLDENVAVAAQWNVYRARLDDAAALATAGEFEAAAQVATNTFTQFEEASGPYGAHEKLESTSHEYYEGFEEELGLVKENAIKEDLAEVQEARRQGTGHLYGAQKKLVGDAITHALDLQRLGVRAMNARMLAVAGKFDAAAQVAAKTYKAFEKANAHKDLESASKEQYKAFEKGLESIEKGAKAGDARAVKSAVNDTLDAAIKGSYAMTTKKEAGAGEIATMQARGFDTATLAGLGGPSTDFAHAAALNIYRHRAFDAQWLAARGEADMAATMAADIYAHFESAKAHEALEHTNHEAYESFEGGLKSLKTTIKNGNTKGIDSAVMQVNDALVTGIERLAPGTQAAVLESAFFRARVQDALALYKSGQNNTAARIVKDLFARFEQNEAGFHETFEHADHKAYETFEGHLENLQSAFSSTNNSAVSNHGSATLESLLGFETTVGSEATVSAAESGFMAARAFDAAALATLGKNSRAATTVQETFGFFEAGAGGFHETLEHANHDLYESFERKLEAVGTAANSNGDVYAAVKAFNAKAVAAVYAAVQNAGGDFSKAAGALASDAFADFENATVHELLEEANHDAYESFEHKLEALIEAAKSGSDVNGVLNAYVKASIRAQFAVVGAVKKAPVGKSSGGESSGESSLSGGPNVVKGVSEDADHVVKIQAVSFDSKSLTVKKGDKVAFKHVGGEAHTVTAYEEKIPDGASYWSSAGSNSQKEAEKAWENGKGAVQSGQAYVHTFETTGTYKYYCIPHESAGMTGSITVEK
ncbi:DUF5059 domain-containing protein [Haladaptatus sp. DFWS20]|uniref:DUF5059 domain-containing protein n=1 Tax=Haladaptatus sp. DFWS20 TaxID=3403467 RepID=UPI003EBABC64